MKIFLLYKNYKLNNSYESWYLYLNIAKKLLGQWHTQTRLQSPEANANLRIPKQLKASFDGLGDIESKLENKRSSYKFKI